MRPNLQFITKIKGILYALISSGTFGLIPLFTIPLRKEEGMNEFSIVFYRYLLSASFIVVLYLADKKSFRISLQSLLRLFCMSLFYAATAVCLVYSYNYIPSGVVTTIHFLYPVVLVFLMTLFYKEPMSKRLIFIAFLAIVGVGFLALSGSKSGEYLPDQTLGEIVLGLTLAVSTAFTYGFLL